MHEIVSFAVYQHPRYAHHLNAATMIRQRNSLLGKQAQSAYIDLAVYVAEGLQPDAFDAEDFLCRLLAVFRCEGTMLPSLTHVQSVMSLVWATKISTEREADLQAAATALFHFIYDEFADQFMLAMKSFGAALRTPVDINASDEDAPTESEEAEPIEQVDQLDSAPPTSKSILH